MKRVLQATANVLAIASLAATLAGCRREAGPELLQQAWKLTAARQVTEALPLVKTYLSWHPADASAHYVLGKCYLNRQDANTTLAKGEFETARHFFGKNHELGVLAREMTPDQFQSALHRETALALMRALYEGDGKGVPGKLLYPVLEEALRQTHEGLRFDPSSGFLQDMEKSLESMAQGSPSPTPTPRPPFKSTEITI